LHSFGFPAAGRCCDEEPEAQERSYHEDDWTVCSKANDPLDESARLTGRKLMLFNNKLLDCPAQ
jgi:hypothetical protein